MPVNKNSVLLFLRIPIIDSQNNHQNHQTAKLTGIFYPGFFGLHGLYQVFGVVLGCPVYHPIFCEDQEQGITKISQHTQQISFRVIPAPECKPAEHRGIGINGNPDIGIGVVILQGCKQYKNYTKNQVKDFHKMLLTKSSEATAMIGVFF